jgi:putative ABC transport system permease protein
MMLAYTVRNMVVRRSAVLPAVIAVATAVGVAACLLSMLAGLSYAVLESGSPRTAMVITRGALWEAAGRIDLPTVQRIMVSPGIAQRDGRPMVSAENIAEVAFKRADGSLDFVNVRGLDGKAFELSLHDKVRVTSGAFPATATAGLLAGARLASKPGYAVGMPLRVGRRQWPVAGSFAAAGTRFDSELWCDRTALRDNLGLTDYQVVYVELEAPAAIAALRDAVKKIDDKLEVLSEREFRGRELARVTPFLTAIGAIVLLLVLAGVVACTNVLHASFLARTRELATLMAIGYTRGRVAALVLQENLILTAIGAAIGTSALFAIRGQAFEVGPLSLVYGPRLSLEVGAVLAAIICTIGVVGGITSVAQTYRLSILNALRD